MPGKIPFPSVYPDPLDPQGVQDMVNGGLPAGQQLAPIPEQTVQYEVSPEEKAAYEAPLPAPSIDQSAGNMERSEMVGVGGAGNAVLFPGLPTGRGLGGAVMDEGEDYLPFGGTKGRENIEETYVRQPEKMAEAVRAGAQAQQDEAKTKSAFYAEQRDRTRTYESALKEQYDLRQAEMQRRLHELEQTSQKYTNNLADRGAFWHNPQNVLAAMGAALMQITTDDRTFGYKLLNGAIQSDLQNRRNLADQHLGYLKSNMAEYDRIAGDRISGMQLAEAEAKRVAAYELERIASQFQGPKAKANAEAIISKLKIDAMEGYMNVYRSGIYNKPTVVDPRIKSSYEKTGKATAGAGYTAYAGASSGQPNAGVPGRPGVPGMSMSGVSGAAGPQQGQPGPFPTLSPEVKKIVEERYSGGSEIVNMAQQDTLRQAYRHAGVPTGTPPQMMSPGQRKAFTDSMETQEKEAYEQLKSVGQGLAQSSGRRSGLRAIQTDMAVVEAAVNKFRSRGLNITMDDILGTRSKATLGSDTAAKWKNLYKAWAATSPENKSIYEAERDKIEAAGTRLNQLLAGTVNSYYKDMAGAAVTVVELPRLQEYAGGNLTYDKLKTFIGEESSQAKSLEDNYIRNLTPAAAAMWLTRTGTKRTAMEGPNLRAYEPTDAPEKGRTEGRKEQPKIENAGSVPVKGMLDLSKFGR